jgi:hypothetical protein
MLQLANLCFYNNRGDVIFEERFHEAYEVWKTSHPGEVIFGPVVKHTWEVEGKKLERSNPNNDSLHTLPDGSGLICFEKQNDTSNLRSDNLLLLDVYGNERMRLNVPWQMTGAISPEFPTEFMMLSGPYPNPATGEDGKFGVKAYVCGEVFTLNWTITREYFFGAIGCSAARNQS